MIYDFNHPPLRRNTNSEKWDTYPEDVLPLWVADMDFASPEAVHRALCERANHGVFGYALEPPELREVIVARMAERYDWQIKADDIVFLPGVIPGFNLACQAVAGPGDRVLVQSPVYPPILAAPPHAHQERRDLPLLRDAGNYAIDFEAFEAAIDDRTRLFILCNPHNPVGRVFTREELTRLAEICLRHGIVVCSDEIHGAVVYSGHRHVPVASLDAEIAHATITLMSPSKTFNIAGLDFSFAIIQDEALRQRFLQTRRGITGRVNLFGWEAGLAAYREGQEWLSQVLQYLQGNRDFLIDTIRLEMPKLSVSPVEGTYLAWIDCRAAGLANPYDFFLEQARVALVDGTHFGSGGEGFVRLNFGCTRAILGEALERMKMALESKR